MIIWQAKPHHRLPSLGCSYSSLLFLYFFIVVRGWRKGRHTHSLAPAASQHPLTHILNMSRTHQQYTTLGRHTPNCTSFLESLLFLTPWSYSNRPCSPHFLLSSRLWHIAPTPQSPSPHMSSIPCSPHASTHYCGACHLFCSASPRVSGLPAPGTTSHIRGRAQTRLPPATRAPLSSGSEYAGLARPTPAAPGSRPPRHRSTPVGSHYSPERGGCGGAARSLAPGPARPMRSAAAQRAGHGGGAALRGPHCGGDGSETRGPEAARGRSQSAAKTGCSLSPVLSGTRLQPDPSRLLRRRRRRLQAIP